MGEVKVQSPLTSPTKALNRVSPKGVIRTLAQLEKLAESEAHLGMAMNDD